MPQAIPAIIAGVIQGSTIAAGVLKLGFQLKAFATALALTGASLVLAKSL